jgi:LysM repeat protein
LDFAKTIGSGAKKLNGVEIRNGKTRFVVAASETDPDMLYTSVIPSKARNLSDRVDDYRSQVCSARMKFPAILCAMLILAFRTAPCQTPTTDPAKSPDAGQLEALGKKIDEQNAKIDALSQEILKLEQEISHIRPGVMIGEGGSASSPGIPAASAVSQSHPATAGNTHTVARGETLTSIAKMYKVTVDELQKANHIEDGRKLQAGQTISIPASATPSSAASASTSP